MRLPTSLLLFPVVVCAADHATMVQVDSVPLSRCLEQIAAGTGARFIVSPQLAQDAPRCNSVAAAPSAASALDAALADSDVAWRLRDDGVFLLARNDALPGAALETLTVEDAAIDGDGDFDTDAPRAPRPAIADLASTTRYAAAELAAKPLLRFNQLGRLAPNVYSSGQSLSIRGVPRDNDYFTGNGVFLDGIDVGTLLLDHNLLAVDDLAQLRYVRSGSAFEYGAGVAGGAIHLDTPDPSPEFGARVAAGGGERSAWSTQAALTGPLGIEGLSARLALSHRDEPRFVRSAVVPALAGDIDQRDAASAKLLFEPEALPGLTVAVNAFRIDADAPDRTVAKPGVGVPFDLFQGISYDLSARDWDLTATGRGVHADYAFSDAASASIWANDLRAQRNAPINAIPNPVNSGQLGDDEDRARFGMRWDVPLFDRLRLYASAERQLLDRQSFSTTRVDRPPINGVAYTQTLFNRLSVANTALTAELAWNADDWRASAGVRRIDERVDFRFRDRFVPDTGTTTDRITLSTRSEYDRYLPVAGFEYDFSPTQSGGISYGRGYRSGGLSEFVVIGEYAPESLATAEIFWRGRWLDDRLSTRASLFRTDWTDRTSIDGTIGAEIIEPFETRIDGAELEIEAQLSSAWSVRGGIGWLDARHRSGAYRLGFREFEIAGLRASDAPRNTALLSAIWRGDGGWSASIDAYRAGPAQSAIFVRQAVREEVPAARGAYTVVDARVAWQGERLGVALTAGNLFDEQYIDRYVEQRAFSRILGEPRQLDLTLSWTF